MGDVIHVVFGQPDPASPDEDHADLISIVAELEPTQALSVLSNALFRSAARQEWARPGGAMARFARVPSRHAKTVLGCAENLAVRLISLTSERGFNVPPFN
jgi:hypothetical protein